MLGKISSFTDTPQIRIFDVYSVIALDQEVAKKPKALCARLKWRE